MPETIRREDNARAYPVSDAQRHYCLDAVKRMQARQNRQKRQKNLRVATLNIGTLTGKSREIADVMKRRRIDILCLQETRWTGGKSGGKARNIGELQAVLQRRGKKNGVAICLSEEWQDKVIETQRKSDRIITMKLVTPDKTFNIVTAYAPQQGCEEDEAEILEPT
ncbi:craniofacial development protein 2-like [Xenia sp. Carnegie-2017]|uniref:craniofacial development protein 2-like n=1 Tax=Xenia sp. Carnegie-2017 TaxID=2897299 RepID=UPI001F0389DD|nr:craniofacial development protein 2-like [Xenia sp. Carnegie-2017]